MDGSFLEAVQPLCGGLRLHCYRMLGSSHDGDDVVQETLLRAWRAKESLEDPALLRPWLYRIATNACLDELKRRPKRAYTADAFPAADPSAPIAPPIDEPVWLEPMPDAWLASATDADPASRYTLKESVALAFVAALSVLSPVQRATLLLRDVVGLSAEETARALELGVGAANSALFRARKTVEEKLGGEGTPELAEAAADVDEAILTEYVRAFEDADVDRLVALLHADVKATMPPSPTWICGRADVGVFFRAMFPTPRCRSLHLARVGANAQPAFGFYRPRAPGEAATLHAISLVTVRRGLITSMDHFMVPESFGAFGLPAML